MIPYWFGAFHVTLFAGCAIMNDSELGLSVELSLQQLVFEPSPAYSGGHGGFAPRKTQM